MYPNAESTIPKNNNVRRSVEELNTAFSRGLLDLKVANEPFIMGRLGEDESPDSSISPSRSNSIFIREVRSSISSLIGS